MKKIFLIVPLLGMLWGTTACKKDAPVDTGSVRLLNNSTDSFSVFLDGSYVSDIGSRGNRVLTDVPVGSRALKAIQRNPPSKAQIVEQNVNVQKGQEATFRFP